MKVQTALDGVAKMLTPVFKSAGQTLITGFAFSAGANLFRHINERVFGTKKSSTDNCVDPELVDND